MHVELEREREREEGGMGGGEEGETGMPGVHFSPLNKKKVNVYCETVRLVEKLRGEGRVGEKKKKKKEKGKRPSLLSAI